MEVLILSMESNLLFSDEQAFSKHVRLIRLLSNNKNRLKSTKTITRLKLMQKKLLLTIYKKLLKLSLISNINSNFIALYCLLKRYFFVSFPWIIGSFLSIRNLAFFIYHFLVLYQAIFLLKMILDWFPIKNWDTASPFKRFLRRVTIDWTKQFEQYLPSFFAWIIVINIAPILLSITEGFYIANDFARFPVSYQFDELMEYVLELNFPTLN
uniref:Uncharacterized protein n=1 Tax=Eustigmatophyceae sp. Chic 10/23 P-6w TaxID=1446905 RepID=A0A451FMG1_9STRA|nr:hypothetical protein Ycf19 [Eustigmatophyceae sp. Chic 10/23 P-6w]QAA11591.1 hypothetical protein Ycf19 [Eustigmatophyceae sp. Chic 10/23 P-6w]